MYPISAQPKDKAEPGGPFDRTIEKSNKAIKLHSIKAKPAKKPGWRNNSQIYDAIQEQEEYNPFLKNSWLIMGQAQFYNADFLQASATFSYIAPSLCEGRGGRGRGPFVASPLLFRDGLVL